MKRKLSQPIPDKVSIETFRDPRGFSLSRLEDKEPSCFNGNVSIEKFRVTVEKIEEPKEVLIARLQKLWSECDNHHHWQPLQWWAKKLGVELKHDYRGKKKESK